MNASLSYWLSPKWYGSYSTSYDFGNKILLGSMFSLTRIGADYLTSVGLSVDPQRQSYMFAVQISPLQLAVDPARKLAARARFVEALYEPTPASGLSGLFRQLWTRPFTAGVVGALPGNPINPPSYFVHTWDVQ